MNYAFAVLALVAAGIFGAESMVTPLHRGAGRFLFASFAFFCVAAFIGLDMIEVFR